MPRCTNCQLSKTGWSTIKRVDLLNRLVNVFRQYHTLTDSLITVGFVYFCCIECTEIENGCLFGYTLTGMTCPNFLRGSSALILVSLIVIRKILALDLSFLHMDKARTTLVNVTRHFDYLGFPCTGLYHVYYFSTLVGCWPSASFRRIIYEYLNVCYFDKTAVAGSGKVWSINQLTTPVVWLMLLQLITLSLQWILVMAFLYRTLPFLSMLV